MVRAFKEHVLVAMDGEEEVMEMDNEQDVTEVDVKHEMTWGLAGVDLDVGTTTRE